MRSRFAYVWEFRIRPEAKLEFLQAYGPEGKWACLFRRSGGYFGTELLRDERESDRFLTIDHWETRAERNAFRERHAVEFAALDAECESLTVSERFIGDFDIVG